jgi:hypothetical protein
MEDVRVKQLIEVLGIETINIGEQRINLIVDKSGYVVIKPNELMGLINVQVAALLKPFAERTEVLGKSIEDINDKLETMAKARIEKIIKEDEKDV